MMIEYYEPMVTIYTLIHRHAAGKPARIGTTLMMITINASHAQLNEILELVRSIQSDPTELKVTTCSGQYPRPIHAWIAATQLNGKMTLIENEYTVTQIEKPVRAPIMTIVSHVPLMTQKLSMEFEFVKTTPKLHPVTHCSALFVQQSVQTVSGTIKIVV